MSQSHDHDDAQPITDRVHDTSWSANLEQPRHADDRALVVEQAMTAIEHTTPGHHVNLVTHEAHGHPESYLTGPLEHRYGDAISWAYVQQCGCGGHVLRVSVEDETVA